jgi:hypothetical protein
MKRFVGVSAVIAAYVHYSRPRASPPLDYKQRKAQFEDARMRMERTLTDVSCSFRLENKPYIKNLPLEQAIRSEITSSIRVPGAKIVFSPNGTGKTRTMTEIIHELMDTHQIAGAYHVETESVVLHDRLSVSDAFSQSFHAPPWTNLWDIFPATKEPILVIVDRVDECLALSRDTETTLRRIHCLVHDLAMASVGTGRGVNFQLFVLTSNAVIARDLLGLNGGRKVCLLAEGKEMVGGHEWYNNWKQKGLKLNKQQVEAILVELGCLFTEETRNEVIELGARAGTIEFVSDLASQQSITNKTVQIANRLESEWNECAAVKRL